MYQQLKFATSLVATTLATIYISSVKHTASYRETSYLTSIIHLTCANSRYHNFFKLLFHAAAAIKLLCELNKNYGISDEIP